MKEEEQKNLEKLSVAIIVEICIIFKVFPSSFKQEKSWKHSQRSVPALKNWKKTLKMVQIQLIIEKKLIIYFNQQGSISNRTEEQVQLKFDAWWYYFGLLGPSLENQIESVVIPFLKFCFSSTVSEATGLFLFLPNYFNHQIFVRRTLSCIN